MSSALEKRRLAEQEIVAAGVREAANRLPWYHQIDLGDGILTNGKDASRERLDRLQLPSLEGKSVLDIGAWDGFFSFQAERRGASRVLATDSHAWSGEGYGSKAAFEFARRTLDSHVEDLDIDVMDISPERVGRFDVVFLLGVIYHLRHPLLALERAASVTRELLVVETAVDLQGLSLPAMVFYPGVELSQDPTNWWGPNSTCAIAMLRSCGFRTVQTVSPQPRAPYRAARAIYHYLQGKSGLRAAYRRDRAVFHARK
jgi:tRNA (mo5U34)-methyltransferase